MFRVWTFSRLSPRLRQVVCRPFNLQAPLLSGQSEVTVDVGPLALVGVWLASPVELA